LWNRENDIQAHFLAKGQRKSVEDKANQKKKKVKKKRGDRRKGKAVNKKKMGIHH